MIILFTGNGKGKTTAALGQAFRTLGRGKRVLMIQFIKGPWKSGEDELVGRFKAQKAMFKETDQELLEGLENFYDFHIKKMGRGFVGILGDTLPKEEHARAAREALEYFETEAATEKWDLMILDEINVAVSLGLLPKEDVLEAVRKVPIEKFVVLTGRDAPQEFIDAADLVTEMKEIKHPFNDGKMAKIALEF
jgi:cob(I)alamin adenosyltransferase